MNDNKRLTARRPPKPQAISQCRHAARNRHQSGGASARHGVALVIVLALLSITMAMTYVMLRSQATTMHISQNASRSSSARQAAHAGLSAAMQKMHSNTWGGVGTTFLGQLNDTDTYEVNFATGDPNLSPTHPDWAEYPYRVTIVSTGYSAEPQNPARRATHRARAVMQLIRRQLGAQPAGWQNVQQHTIYQWANATVPIELPFRAEGPLHLQGPLSLMTDYPNPSKPFDGTIDEVAILDEALSAGDLKAIHDEATTKLDGLQTEYSKHSPIAWWRLNETSGTTAADSAGNQHGVYRGATFGAAGAPGDPTGRGARFDGLNDYVDVGKLDVSGSQLTILAWFKADDFGYNDGRIVSKATSPSTGDHYWMLSTIAYDGEYRLRFRVRSSGWTKTLIASSGDLSANTWTFAAAVYDGHSMKLFKDGQLVGVTTKSGSLNTAANVPVYIGDNPPGSTRARYLRDLEAMRVAGAGDFRMFSGPIDVPRFLSSDTNLSLLEDDLQVTLNDVPSNTSTPISHPGSVTAYQLFAGGKTYYADEITVTSLSNTSLLPDVHNNPLGIFYRNGAINIYDNVTIQGTLITDGGSAGPDMNLWGTNVQLLPAEIPPLEGASTQLELPVALVKDDVFVQNDSSASVSGLMAVWDDFEIKRGNDTTSYDMQGRLVTKELKVRQREQWDQSTSWWRDRANDYLFQLNNPNPIAYFPPYVEATQSLTVSPTLRIRPAQQPVSYHWQDWSTPLFVPHANDGALRWDLVEWTDDL